jgi:trans-aconitate methyltransferase
MFKYVGYFFRSVKLRGFIATMKLILAEKRSEKKYGINTLAVKKSGSEENHDYQGAGYLVLHRILPKMITLTGDINFFDIGCGKGRALFVAERMGYSNLKGIDLDDELIMLAKQNLKNYELTKMASVIDFETANAINFNYENVPIVYFLFNPFNDKILEMVLEKIVLAAKSPTWFVYMNPVHKYVFESNTNFKLEREFFTTKYLEASVYKLNRLTNS